MDDARHYEWRMAIRWGDLDAMGHVNNTIYFRYFEQARISWFNDLGFNTSGKGLGPILAHVSCDFVKPLTYPGDILVRQSVTRVGRSSVDHDLLIVRADAPEDVYARGKSVVVWMDYDQGRSVPWPESVRALITPTGAT